MTLCVSVSVCVSVCVCVCTCQRQCGARPPRPPCSHGLSPAPLPFVSDTMGVEQCGPRGLEAHLGAPLLWKVFLVEAPPSVCPSSSVGWHGTGVRGAARSLQHGLCRDLTPGGSCVVAGRPDGRGPHSSGRHQNLLF